MENIMKLITASLQKKLEAGCKNEESGKKAIPVMKLFYPVGSATWIISSINEDGNMFGLCDLGQGSPEMGYVSLQELTEFKGHMGLGIERDRYWEPKKGSTLSDYAEKANEKGYIVDRI